MSARMASRRIGQSALNPSKCSSAYWIGPYIPRRHLSNPFKRRAADPQKPDSLNNPILENILKQRALRSKESKDIKMPVQDKPHLPPYSIFHPDNMVPGITPTTTPEQREILIARNEQRQALMRAEHDMNMSALKLDPVPLARQRWERKMVIRSIQRRGRMTADVKLARSERQSLYKSHNLPTSVKKLTKVMRQIQGMTLEEAMVQLRFSRKKVARDIIKGLQIARDEAVVKRGMGLGAKIEGPVVDEAEQNEIEELAKKKKKEEEAAEAEMAGQETGERKNRLEVQSKLSGREKELEELRLLNGTRIRPKTGEVTTIELKNGKTKKVYDPTEIYIDQAWVGKGEQWKSLEFRARGRVNTLVHRTTSFSVLLKEEKTRMRISEEIKKKRANRKLWLPLPDRPIPTQRQYCMW